MDNFERFCLNVFLACVVVVVVTFTVGFVHSKISSPVEENNNSNAATIDSLVAVNDSIKLKVEHLDSIKNAKVIEVSTLDNDSTLKLFYKLVSE